MSLREATVITGFLGSGKTTLLNQMLVHPQNARSAVLVNEFGEVGIDNHLLRFTSERVAVVAGGCICCSVREDIEEAVRHLLEQEEEGVIPPFEHLYVETSGLADPAPLIQTFQSSPVLRSRFELTSVVATVDAALGTETLNRFTDAARQVALADVVIVTKMDLCNAPGHVERLAAEIKAVNSDAKVLVPKTPERNEVVSMLLDQVRAARNIEPARNLSGTRVHLLNTGITSFGLVIEQPLDWTAFGVWLTWLLHRHGSDVLRVKGLLWVSQSEGGPVEFHAVQHMVFPPKHHNEWGATPQQSHLTFIVNNLEASLIERSLRVFMRLAGEKGLGNEGRNAAMPLGAGRTIGGRPVRRPGAPRWMK
ncbi:GTP-binding protein [Caballeronia sp. LZ029]|uniref:CobW family GTP-binding protein n=1 Tax=Caballeronia sp. LZ029 TaxID=3038564 RepID=UPI002858E8B8|nr:GTP-binding protein [Caballeronia sp. LZ029]MDR5749036.1 GTP-binding protein [Caballeronia sp. LZ029]